jgi:hypothetical protein
MTRATLVVAAVLFYALAPLNHAEARFAPRHIQTRSQNATYVIAQNYSGANL